MSSDELLERRSGRELPRHSTVDPAALDQRPQDSTSSSTATGSSVFAEACLTGSSRVVRSKRGRAMGTEERRNRDFSKGPVWDETRARWLVEIRYPDGSRRRSRFRREREASRAWSAEQTKIESGGRHEQAPKNMTFGALLDLYRAHAKVHVPSYASYTAPALKVWEAGIPGDTPLARVTPTIIDAVKIKRAEKVQKCSVDRNLQVLRRLFNWPSSKGSPPTTPCAGSSSSEPTPSACGTSPRRTTDGCSRRRPRFIGRRSCGRLSSLPCTLAFGAATCSGCSGTGSIGSTVSSEVPRTKSGKPHALPLSATAYAALERLWAARGDPMSSRTPRAPTPARQSRT